MENLGFIGYGSMGSMILNGFLAAGKLNPKNVFVSTRSPARLKQLIEHWDVNIAKTNIEVAQACRYVFVCVKPLEVKEVLDGISPYLTEDKHLISIAASLTIKDIESEFTGKISKIIPSVTSEVGEGISLICHNPLVKLEDKELIESLFSTISTVKTIKEENFEAAADLTSCAPGLIAALFNEFVEAGVRHSTLSQAEAEEMVISTLYGTAKLFMQRKMGFPETISRVATKGGITEEGVIVLRQSMPSVFDALFHKTLAKHNHLKQIIKQQYTSANLKAY